MLHLFSRHVTLSVPYILVVLIVSGAWSLSNFFVKYKNAYSNSGYGRYCFDLSQYKPTCGWKLYLYTPVPFNKLDVFDCTYNTSDNYTFILTSKLNEGDLTRGKSNCTNMNYFGPFGSVVPDIFITWYCICDRSTGGECMLVSEPTTTTQLPTPPPTLSPLLGSNKSWNSSTQTRSDACYIGNQFSSMPGTQHLVDCASTCSSLSQCTGINYRHSTKQCDLVYDDTDSNPRLLEAETGCFFWRVFAKS